MHLGALHDACGCLGTPGYREFAAEEVSTGSPEDKPEYEFLHGTGEENNGDFGREELDA